jgi:hypothetical protein
MKNYGKVILLNSLVAIVVMFLSVFIFPHGSNAVIYRGILLYLPFAVPLAIGSLIGFLVAFPLFENNRNSLGSTYLILAAIIAIGGCVLISSGTNWKTCQLYGFKQRPAIVNVAKKGIRFTPLDVAYQDLVGSLNSGKYTVHEDDINAMDLNAGFGYVVPITPDGPINTFIAENDGFMAFDDTPELTNDQRVRRVHQKYVIGEGMEWLDNVWRNLYSSDWFCAYDHISYLQLDPDNADKFTGVVPKIKYEFHFPCFVVPVWGGVALFHENGKIEQLTVEEAKKDKRLKGKRIFPSSLSRQYVSAQIYDQGFLGGWYNREGKIKIPKLPGRNQMPFFTPGADKHEYFVIAAEPAGEAFALFRLYYVDSFSGERTYYEFNPDKGVLGPNAAMARVKTLQGYKWYDSGEKAGDHRIIEAVYLTDDRGGLHWKFTITTKDFKGITATAVVDAAMREVKKFETRKAFYSWFYGEEMSAALPQAVSAKSQAETPLLLRIKSLREALKKLATEMDLLEKDFQERNADK